MTHAAFRFAFLHKNVSNATCLFHANDPGLGLLLVAAVDDGDNGLGDITAQVILYVHVIDAAGPPVLPAGGAR